jgi:hypothetical protein
MIRAVTLADIQRAAKRVLDPDHLLVVAVGQPVGLDKAMASEAKPAPSPVGEAAPPPPPGAGPDAGPGAPGSEGGGGIR